MKTLKYILSVGMAVCLLALSAAEIDGLYFWKNGTYTRFDVMDMLFADDKITVGYATFDVAAIKSDSLMSITGGVITLSTTGDGNKGLKSKADLSISAGELSITQSGKYIVENNDPGYVVGIKASGDLDINGGKHYFKCYDDCLNTAGAIRFDGGIVVCHGYGNDAIDSNYGQAGAIQIGNGVVLGYSSKGAPEEGFDSDNNSYIQITGYGIGISGGANQGGGGGWGGWGGSSSSIGSAVQGYCLSTSSISYAPNRYYTLADASGNNLVTYAVEASFSSSLSLFTATGMTKGSSYTVKYSTAAPTDATTAWHGLYLGSSATGATQVLSFTAQ